MGRKGEGRLGAEERGLGGDVGRRGERRGGEGRRREVGRGG